MGEKGNDKIRLHARFITSYKKNTVAVFFSFALILLLMTTMLILMHTNHKIANIQDKMAFTPTDCYIRDLSPQQIAQLKGDKDIEHLGVNQPEYNNSFERNKQNLFIDRGDDTYTTLMAKVIEGRLPQKEGEVAAEKWALLNMGIEPTTGRHFTVYDSATGKTKEYTLVGILSDMYGNKKYGTLRLFTTLDQASEDPYVAYLGLADGVDYDEKMKELKAELGVSGKQIKVCPGREDFDELYRSDAKVIALLMIICIVIFYGIYRISFIAREKQYGILRAVGMKRGQLQKLMLMELYEIYLVSIPIGVGIGYLLASFIIFISGDRDKVIYFYNQKVEFVPEIPVLQIFICVMLVALFIAILGYVFGRKAGRAPIAETIAGTASKKKEGRSFFPIGAGDGKMRTLFHMAGKYIVKDLRTSTFVVLTICLGITLFTGLAYQAQTLKHYREDTKEMWYLNGQYEMSMRAFGSTEQGVSRKSAAEIKKIEGVRSVKTMSGIPIRVVDENQVKRNDAYYDEMNEKLTEIYGYDCVGYDGQDQIYKSILYGYDKGALQALKNHVISGDFDPEHLADDEIILSVLRMDDTKENDMPGSFREGTPLMDYKVGDKIKMKYRADFDTDSETYEALKDRDGQYIYKTYKIAAIVSFSYMFDCNRTVYPLLITGDEKVQEMAPGSSFQCLYIDGEDHMSLSKQIDLERRLIKAGSKNSNVSTRSMISEIEENEMFYRKQMFYVYGIAIVACILVLINMINNLRYRMQTRTREICMLRAVGMSVSMTRRILMIENMILGFAAVVVSFALTQPVLRYLYLESDMRAFGHPFHYDYTSFLLMSAAALLLCLVLSFGILKSWKTRQIMEGMGKIE